MAKAFEVIGAPVLNLARNLRFERVLEVLERPLMNLLRSSEGEPHIEFWVDCDNHTERWLLFRTGESELVQFLHKRRTLRQLLHGARGGIVFVRDQDKNLDLARFSVVATVDIPPDLWPTEDSFYDPTLDPSDICQEQVFLNQSQHSERCYVDACGAPERLGEYAYDGPLYNADPDCIHEVVVQWSGVACRKCRGWNCL